MRIFRTDNYQGMSRKAANIISAQVITKPDSVLGLATGSTPIGIYEQLIKWYQKNDVDFSSATTFNLDEYKGLSPEDEQSYHKFMHKNFFDHINVKPENIHVPDGLSTDDQAECEQYDSMITEAGGIDLQLLGLGHNGHIGFNEPDTAFECETRVVDLTPSTIEANARFFDSEDKVPKQALSMGIKSIMQAKKILVVVSGESKAKIVKEAFKGPVTPKVPASILQLHPHVTLVGDRAALALI